MKKIKFIAIEQLLEMIENKENFKLVEALKEEGYKEGHILGAINIPADTLQEMVPHQLEK